jgi:GWxTD domain-containing protein
LQTDAEREHFIEQFWQRRDPTPGTPRNEFKEEHYRRIAFANDRFRTTAGIPGWKTDRGRIYITFGPPDELDRHPNGGPLHGDNLLYPFETWRYRYIAGIGNDVSMDFADEARNGAYHMTKDPAGNGTRIENPAGRGGGATERFLKLNAPPKPPQ